MQRRMMKSKLHNATVTSSRLGYQGSLAIDVELMRDADILEGEEVHVFNITTGARLATYAVPAPAGSREIGVLGAAARLIAQGDRVIILTYATYDEAELANYRPTILILGEHNNVLQTKHVTTN